jgi:hypothetical protein
MKKKYLYMAAVIAVISLALLSAGCKKNPVPTSYPTALALPAYPLSVVIDDCDDNDNVDAWGGYWFTYDDNKTPNFGKSTVYPRNGAAYTMSAVGPDWDSVANGPNVYAARMYGTVEEWTKPYVAFIGEGIQMSPMENPQDFSNFTGIKFWAKVGSDDQIGDYRISFKTSTDVCPDASAYDYFGVIFHPTTTWKLYDYKFKDDFILSYNNGLPPAYSTVDEYKAASMKNVTDIQLQTKNNIPQTPTKGKSYTADFWVDNIYLYRN